MFVYLFSGTSCSNSSFPSITYRVNDTVVEPNNSRRLSPIDIQQINFLYKCEEVALMKTSFAEFGVQTVANKFIPHFVSYQGKFIILYLIILY